jgi:FlaA1/EpsC-like NDP-sugar epimerase
MLVADSIALPLCFALAIMLRIGYSSETVFDIRASGTASLVTVVLLVPLLAVPLLWFSGLYRSVIRYLDFKTIMLSGLALGTAVVCVYLGSKLIFGSAFPRSSILIFWFISFSYLTCSRFVVLALLHKYRKLGAVAKRVAIYGAGVAGAQTAQALHSSTEYLPVCFFDDAKALRGSVVAGLRVYGADELGSKIARMEIEQIVIAMPSAAESQRRDAILRIESYAVEMKVLPSIADLVNGKVTVSSIRNVDLEDLLGRAPIPPRVELFTRCITGKAVMVTGAGGSIGSELCRQIASQAPAHLVLFEMSEFALYAIEADLRQHFPSLHITPVMENATNALALERTLLQHHVKTLYHAAAYKHVPLVESNIRAGVYNNVVSTLAVANAAERCELETCVLISTDKAVRPTNVMGASKRVAEQIIQAYAAETKGKTTFSMVRFGNVLGSSGSVVPKFMEQIRRGEPITVTDPEIIRYFMLIPEAAQLVIQAGAMAKGGEVFVLDMGDPVKIADLARQLIYLAGKTEKTVSNPQGDIEIKFTGLRPGEKLYEELLLGENTQASQHPRIMLAHEAFTPKHQLLKQLEALFNAIDEFDEFKLLSIIRELVPEFNRQSHSQAKVTTQHTALH